MSLADEALGHQPLIVRGSEKFKRKVMEAAVLSELNIIFADAFMQQEFQQRLEEAEDERRRFRERGGKFLPRRHVPKSHPQSLADTSLQALADAGFSTRCEALRAKAPRASSSLANTVPMHSGFSRTRRCWLASVR